MPAAPGATPRKMLPPPITMATSTPSRVTSAISATIRSITSRLIPYASAPISASPDSLSRMRLYAGAVAGAGAAATAAIGATATGELIGGLRELVRAAIVPAPRVSRSGLRHRCDLGREIVFLLLETLADDVEIEAV